MNFITLIIVSFFLEAFSRNTVWASPLFIFSSIISCLLVLLGATRLVNKKIPLRNISAEYWGASCSTAILQIFMVTTSMLFAMRLAETSSKMEDYWSFWEYSTVLVLAIGFFQIVSAHLFLHAQGHKSPVRQGALIAVFIVTSSSIFPPIGGNLASYAFQIMASGGRQCSVLRWSASPSENVAFLIEANGPYSKPLRILLDDNGFYQVRLKDIESDEVHFVPHTSVASMQSCPPATK
jgi:MFS family permease